MIVRRIVRRVRAEWARFWMRFAGLGLGGRLATRLATLAAPPYKSRVYLARLWPEGYISPKADIHHGALRRGRHVFIGDRVIIHQSRLSHEGVVELGDHVKLYADALIETGEGGGVSIGPECHVQRWAIIVAFRSSVRIGRNTRIAPRCAFYPFDHWIPGQSLVDQETTTKGDIVVGDDVLFGVGATVLSGVTIGDGAVIGAGSVVTRDIPAGAIAAGVPARIVRMRDDHVASGGLSSALPGEAIQ
jgi:acetyltransferase-like isoleucine patch superfamily enzyme